MTKRRRTGDRAIQRIALVAMVAVGIAASAVGCSDDEDKTSGADTTANGASTSQDSKPAPSSGGKRSTLTSPTTTVPRPVPVSKPAKRKGADDCADTTPQAVVRRYLPELKRSKASDTAAVRRSIAAQIKQLKKARSGTMPPPVAAAVYAVSKPRTQRSGAYQGCLSSLVKSAQG